MVNQIILSPGTPAEPFDSWKEIPERHHKSNPAWERLAIVIRYSGEQTVSGFGRRLGINRPERLYQIRKGNNRISQKLARTIHAEFPRFNVSWLMFGEQNIANNNKPANVATDSPVHNNPDSFTKKKITLDVIPELALPAIRLLQIHLACIRENHEITALYNKQDITYPHLDEMCSFLEEVKANIHLRSEGVL